MIAGTAIDIVRGFGIASRLASVAVSTTLILRSLVELLFGRAVLSKKSILFRVSDVFVVPVRSILPDELTGDRFDYSPLIAAVAMLLLGLGAERFCVIITMIIGYQ